ncbi:MAG: hypothetical protein AAFQ43_04585 [Bacteroidota bacterium]
MSLALAIIGTLALAVGLLYLIVRAFEESTLWGIACLLCGPLVFVFAVLHWDAAKAGLISVVAGIAVLLVGGAVA